MRTLTVSSWNMMVDRLLSSLRSSHLSQKQLYHEIHADAVRRQRELAQLRANARPRRGRRPKAIDELGVSPETTAE